MSALTEPSPHSQPKLRRTLATWAAVSLSVAAMGASLAINLNPQGAGATVGRAVPLTFVLATIGVLLVAYGFARVCSRLNHAGSVFNTKQMTTASDMVYAAVGDFNKDGWPDFVGANESSANGYLDIFQNYTWQNENCTTYQCTAYSGAAR